MRFAKLHGTMLLVIAFVAILFLKPAPIYGDEIGPSFDCSAATAVDEKLICSDDSLRRADRLMGDTYFKYRDSVGAYLKDEVIREQRAWIAYRDQACGVTRSSVVTGADQAALVACFSRQYQARLEQLTSLLSRITQSSGGRPTVAASDENASAKKQLLAGDQALALGETAFNSRSYEEAAESFRRAAELGNAVAMNNLGFLYQGGKGVPTDYGQSVYWYRKAADLGNPAAMNNLGGLYQTGIGAPRDYAQSMYWYQKAADLGNSDAMVGVGSLFQHGRGVPTDYQAAMDWYRKAANLQSAFGMYQIGYMYQLGMGVPPNLDEARNWYEKAASLGFANAKVALEQLTATPRTATPPFAQRTLPVANGGKYDGESKDRLPNTGRASSTAAGVAAGNAMLDRIFSSSLLNFISGQQCEKFRIVKETVHVNSSSDFTEARVCATEIELIISPDLDQQTRIAMEGLGWSTKTWTFPIKGRDGNCLIWEEPGQTNPNGILLPTSARFCAVGSTISGSYRVHLETAGAETDQLKEVGACRAIGEMGGCVLSDTTGELVIDELSPPEFTRAFAAIKLLATIGSGILLSLGVASFAFIRRRSRHARTYLTLRRDPTITELTIAEIPTETTTLRVTSSRLIANNDFGLKVGINDAPDSQRENQSTQRKTQTRRGELAFLAGQRQQDEPHRQADAPVETDIKQKNDFFLYSAVIAGGFVIAVLGVAAFMTSGHSDQVTVPAKSGLRVVMPSPPIYDRFHTACRAYQPLVGIAMGYRDQGIPLSEAEDNAKGARDLDPRLWQFVIQSIQLAYVDPDPKGLDPKGLTAQLRNGKWLEACASYLGGN